MFFVHSWEHGHLGVAFDNNSKIVHQCIPWTVSALQDPAACPEHPFPKEAAFWIFARSTDLTLPPSNQVVDQLMVPCHFPSQLIILLSQRRRLPVRSLHDALNSPYHLASRRPFENVAPLTEIGRAKLTACLDCYGAPQHNRMTRFILLFFYKPDFSDLRAPSFFVLFSTAASRKAPTERATSGGRQHQCCVWVDRIGI